MIAFPDRDPQPASQVRGCVGGRTLRVGSTHPPSGSMWWPWARYAGSPLATMLAPQGLNVCLLDRAPFPADTPSTHMIQPCGVEILDRLGVLDAILATDAVPFDRMTIVNEDVRVETTTGGMFELQVLVFRDIVGARRPVRRAN